MWMTRKTDSHRKSTRKEEVHSGTCFSYGKKIGSYGSSCDTVFISHGDCQEEAEFLAAKVKEKYPVQTQIINHVGATIGAHSGPGTMALFFVGDVR